VITHWESEKNEKKLFSIVGENINLKIFFFFKEEKSKKEKKF